MGLVDARPQGERLSLGDGVGTILFHSNGQRDLEAGIVSYKATRRLALSWWWSGSLPFQRKGQHDLDTGRQQAGSTFHDEGDETIHLQTNK